MLVPMRRVQIVVPRPLADQALRLVHRAGVLHMAPFRAPADVSPSAFASSRRETRGSLEWGDRLRRALEETARLGSLLGPSAPAQESLAGAWELDRDALLEAAAKLRPVNARAERLTGERQRLSADLDRLEGYQSLVEGLAGAVGRLPQVRGYAATGIIVASRHRAVIGLVSEELEAATGGRCEVFAADLPEERSAAVLLYPARMAVQVSALLGGRDLEEVSLPADLQGVPLDELGPRMAAQADGLRARIGELEGDLRALAEAHAPAVTALRLVIEDRLAEMDELERAAGSDHLVVLSGWVPGPRLGELRTALGEALGEQVMVLDEGVAVRERDEAPVALANGPLARTFEPLARFVAVPRYGTIDPTPLLALTFPAFVGIMVGDAGYGLVLLGLLVLARGRLTRSRARGLWPIGLTVSAATIAFGILFGEVFGETGHQLLGLEPIWLSRREAVLPLLLVALSIGLTQVSLGLVLGVVNASLVGRRREALGRVALLAGLLTIVMLGGAGAGVLPSELMVLAGAALTVALVISLLALGIAGPIEMLRVLGNVLSYARIMAIALAGVMLALVADALGDLVPGVLLGLLVAILLHLLNLVLGFFDGTIQGLRLHYVEFFTHFVEPGGTPYAPFLSVLARGEPTASGTGG